MPVRSIPLYDDMNDTMVSNNMNSMNRLSFQ